MYSMQVLLDSFEVSMGVLQELAEKNQRRVEKLEHVCLKNEEEHRNRVKDLESTYGVHHLHYDLWLNTIFSTSAHHVFHIIVLRIYTIVLGTYTLLNSTEHTLC